MKNEERRCDVVFTNLGCFKVVDELVLEDEPTTFPGLAILACLEEITLTLCTFKAVGLA